MPKFKNISLFFKSAGFFSLMALLWSACVQPPEYPDVPAIQFVNIQKDTIIQSQDSNFITISFTDGDGDLGSDDVENLFISDLTIPNRVLRQKIPQIPPQGVGNGISGEIKFLIAPASSCCDSTKIPCVPDDDAGMEVAKYSVRIVDRAGNESNELFLPPIYMICNQ